MCTKARINTLLPTLPMGAALSSKQDESDNLSLKRV